MRSNTLMANNLLFEFETNVFSGHMTNYYNYLTSGRSYSIFRFSILVKYIGKVLIQRTQATTVRREGSPAIYVSHWAIWFGALETGFIRRRDFYSGKPQRHAHASRKTLNCLRTGTFSLYSRAYRGVECRNMFGEHYRSFNVNKLVKVNVTIPTP